MSLTNQPAELAPFSKKFLFVSKHANSSGLAWQLAKEGNDVKMYIENPYEKDSGDGFFDKVDVWGEWIDWSDVIVFDEIGFGKIVEELRAKGKHIIGGDTYTDRLEEDREFGQAEMKSVGMTTLPHWDFTDFDEAIAFIKEKPGQYVFKPSGEEPLAWEFDIKSLLLISKEEDSRDLLEALEHNKKTWAKKVKCFQLQKFVAGVEIAVGAFFNGEDFIYPINVNCEHKKLFPGDIGPYTGEMGCYDDTTEVLTRNGWKFFKDAVLEDEFATMNPTTSLLEYHRPSAVVHYTHHKKLVQIKNRATDILVTPDHNMFGQEANAYKKNPAWGFVKAQNLPNQFVAPRTAQWIGKERDMFVLPSCVLFHYGGKTLVEKQQQPIYMPMDDWLSFLGIWLAEGSTAEKSYAVHVAQVNPKKAAAIDSIIKKLPFRFKKIKGGWKCYNKQLWMYLRPLGAALTKYVPQEYKELSSRQLSILFDAMCLGDGNLQKTGFRIYYTVSKKLADDVQEILLKLGRVGIVRERAARKGAIGDRQFKVTHPCFEVIERIKKTVAWLDRRDVRMVSYSGTVHCAEVPYHTLYVRRNGKPLWCGNTLMFWSESNKIFRATLERMRDKLRESRFCGYVDVNCIANSKGIYPLEFTTRFGYPTIGVQMEGVTSRWGEFLYAIARGESFDLKTKRGFQIGVVIAVPPYPFDDDVTFSAYKDTAILFKKRVFDGIYVVDVKLVNDDWLIAGQIGYILVITGSNSTVEGARKHAYRRVENITVPNMYYRTDIGLKWLHDSDRLQTWGVL